MRTHLSDEGINAAHDLPEQRTPDQHVPRPLLRVTSKRQMESQPASAMEHSPDCTTIKNLCSLMHTKVNPEEFKWGEKMVAAGTLANNDGRQIVGHVCHEKQSQDEHAEELV